MHLVKYSSQLWLIGCVFLVHRQRHQLQAGRAKDVSQRVRRYREAKKSCWWRLFRGFKACLLSVDEWREVTSMIAGLIEFEYPLEQTV